MTKTTRRRIIRHRRDGYRLWRIADMEGVSITDVAEVLVDAGVIHESMVEAWVATEMGRDLQNT